MSDINQIIEQNNKENPVVLYMKGDPTFPQCGFSSTVVNILNMHNIDYEAVNILEDPNIRISLSEHSNWPTIPQLFVKGELIGVCDIAIELHNNGELENLFKSLD